MIIKRAVPSSRPHFPRHQNGSIDVRPFLLYCFSMRAADEAIEVKREPGVARRTMCWEMEFRDEKHDCGTIAEFHLHWIVRIDALLDVFRPRTCYVVG